MLYQVVLVICQVVVAVKHLHLKPILGQVVVGVLHLLLLSGMGLMELVVAVVVLWLIHGTLYMQNQVMVVLD